MRERDGRDAPPARGCAGRPRAREYARHRPASAGSSPEATAALARGEWPAYAGTYAQHDVYTTAFDRVTRLGIDWYDRHLK